MSKSSCFTLAALQADAHAVARKAGLLLAVTSALLAPGCGETDDDAAPSDEPALIQAQPRAARPIVQAEVARQAERADLVFHGVIEKIEHHSLFETLPDKARSEWPMTFVTYRVLEGIKGGAAGERITLRFLGGPMQDGKRMVGASNVPLFSVGNSDILFVKQNGLWWCPLAGSERGLFRVVDGEVYTHDGRAMLLENGQLAVGAWRDLPQARISWVRGQRFERQSRRATSAAAPAPRAAASVASFIASVRTTLAGKSVPVARAQSLSVGPDHPLKGGPGRGL